MGSNLTELVQPLDLHVELDHPPRWNVAPTDAHPVVEWRDNRAEITVRTWGFSTRSDGRKGPINARLETVHERGMFQTAVQQHRVVVPATGWYEWLPSPLGRHPHHLRPRGGQGCWMAGIHAGSSGGFAVLTQHAASSIRHIHERMPVLLRLTDVIPWLEDGLQPREPVAVEHWPVSMDVNRVGAQGAHLASPLSTLF